MHVLFFILVGLAGQAPDQQDAKDEQVRALGPFKVIAEVEYREPRMDQLRSHLVVTETQLRSGNELRLKHPRSHPLVTEAQLQTDAELRLRSLGIEALPKPVLYIHVTVIPYKFETTFGNAYWVEVSDHDRTLLDFRNAYIAVPGNTIALGAEEGNGGQDIRQAVKDKVDEFANAWLKTHPPKPATAEPKGDK